MGFITMKLTTILGEDFWFTFSFRFKQANLSLAQICFGMKKKKKKKRMVFLKNLAKNMFSAQNIYDCNNQKARTRFSLRLIFFRVQ